MAMTDSISLASKFTGCLVGGLLGDCLGAPYEMNRGLSNIVDLGVSKTELQEYFDKLEGSYFECMYAPVEHYTDDTAMTKCIAESLIAQEKFDALDIAKRFVEEYFSEPGRGYGAHVGAVFRKLQAQEFKDPFGPAKEQFNGSGSCGNGGAMRVAPLALFCHSDYKELINLVQRSAEITHTHKQGYNGTILQAIAVHQSLYLDPKETLDTQNFLSQLIEKMSQIEKDDEGYSNIEQGMLFCSLGLDDPYPYQTQLKKIHMLLSKKEGADDKEVVTVLGNSLAALYSVPTAIFCFLRACAPIPEIETENPFRRTIQYAISLGGDTDTIANMAGSIAGAYYGYSTISKNLQKHCEATEKFIAYADKLHKITRHKALEKQPQH